MAKQRLRFVKKSAAGGEPSLVRIIAGILVVCAVLYAGYAFFSRSHETTEGGAAAAGVLDEARAKLTANDAAGARALVQPIVDGDGDAALVPGALVLLSEIEIGAGNRDAALALLKRASEEFPGAKEQPDAAVRYARLLEEAGRADEARPLLEDIKNTTPSEIRAAAVVGLAHDAEKKGDLTTARDQYVQALRDAVWGSAPAEEAIDGLGRMNVALIFSREMMPESKPYEVQSGDNLTSIGIKLNTTQGLLIRANDLPDPTRLNLGQRLKYTPKDFRIVIDRSACNLYLLDNNGIFKRYKVGLGMPGHETTLGKFKIGNKEKDPIWHKPGEGPIPAGDPRNELGTRWMPLVPTVEGLPTDLGIHGTIAPETIGLYSSHGCARMLPADVEELYDLVVRSTPVEIVEKFDPAVHLVAQDGAVPPSV